MYVVFAERAVCERALARCASNSGGLELGESAWCLPPISEGATRNLPGVCLLYLEGADLPRVCLIDPSARAPVCLYPGKPRPVIRINPF